MTGFWIVAALLAALAVAFVATPLVRWRRAHSEASRLEANASIYREQLAELELEAERGAITREEFDRASREIERRVVAEHVAPEGFTSHSFSTPKTAAILLAILLPAFAGVAYWKLGEPRALDPAAMQKISPQQIEAMVERLSVRLQQTPDDAEGWAMLGRSLFVLGRHEPAARAFARALQLAPQDLELLGGLLQALALAGQDKFERADYAGAIAYWERILRFAPPESELAKTVNQSIADARKLSGQAAPSQVATVQGTVSLDAKVKARAAPGDTVFVIARAAKGPRMPLAVVRTTVAALPYHFTLDDGMAMTQGSSLSKHASVVIVARVSKSGNALPQKGDLEGTSAPIPPDASGVKVVISRVVD